METARAYRENTVCNAAESEVGSYNYRVFRSRILAAGLELQAETKLGVGDHVFFQTQSEISQGLVEFCEVRHDFCVIVSNVQFRKPVELSFTGDGWLHFHYCLSGVTSYCIEDLDPVQSSVSSAFIVNEAGGMSLTSRFRTELPLRWVTINIKPSALFDYLGVDANWLPPHIADFLHGDPNTLLNMEGQLTRQMRALTGQLVLQSKPTPLRSLVLKAKAQELISLHLEQLASPESRNDGDIPLTEQDQRNINDVKQLMEETLCCGTGLPDLAREVGINRNKLSQGFHQMFGVTFQDYLLSLRMARAEAFMLNGEGTLKDLASTIGYTHASNASAAIKRYFGVAPRQLAKRVPVAL